MRLRSGITAARRTGPVVTLSNLLTPRAPIPRQAAAIPRLPTRTHHQPAAIRLRLAAVTAAVAATAAPVVMTRRLAMVAVEAVVTVAGAAAITVAATAAEAVVIVIVAEVAATVAEAAAGSTGAAEAAEAVVDTPVVAEVVDLTAVGAAIRTANLHRQFTYLNIEPVRSGFVLFFGRRAALIPSQAKDPDDAEKCLTESGPSTSPEWTTSRGCAETSAR